MQSFTADSPQRPGSIVIKAQRITILTDGIYTETLRFRHKLDVIITTESQEREAAAT